MQGKPDLWDDSQVFDATNPENWPTNVLKESGDLIWPDLPRVHVTGEDPYRRKFYHHIPVADRESFLFEVCEFAREIEGALLIEEFVPINLEPERFQLNHLCEIPHFITDDRGRLVVRKFGGVHCVTLRAFCGIAPRDP